MKCVREVVVTVLKDFEDPLIGPQVWNGLIEGGPGNNVFRTYQWQRTWWESFGRGELLLVVAHRDGQVVAIAPLFGEAGMIYFVGSGGSDYLGFVGDVSDADLLQTLLDAARTNVPDFIGFVFYMVPDLSSLDHPLGEVARGLGLTLFDEGELVAPVMKLAGPEQAIAAAEKSSLVRHEKIFRREGRLEVQHLTDGQEILPHLDEFFDQHVSRWHETPYPSLFVEPKQREFYRQLTQSARREGWLRFTRLSWNGQPIAFHFGFCYAGNFLWYKPSFDVQLARRSPGEVLLRQLLLRAAAENVSTFDFGIGDEPFKRRFATQVNRVRTWGLYAPERLAEPSPAGRCA